MTLENISEWFKIVNRVLCDNIPKTVDLNYLHAETEDNELSSFQVGAEFYLEGFTPKIGITWADESVFEEMCKKYGEKDPSFEDIMREKLKPNEKGAMVGYLGFKHWGKNLVKLGVKEEDILLIEPSFDYPQFTTDSEAGGLVHYCRQKGIQEVCITASPFHQVRTYISDVSALLREGATDLKLYSRPGESLDWNEEVVHSQGVEKGTRGDILERELWRICSYQESGNPPLSNLKEVLDYLDNRD